MSNSNQEYITRDFYDANMAEFRATVREIIAAADARTDRAIAEMKADFANMRADFANMKTEFANMKADFAVNQMRFDNMERRLDNMEKAQDNFFRNAGFVAAGMTLFFTAIQVLLTFIK